MLGHLLQERESGIEEKGLVFGVGVSLSCCGVVWWCVLYSGDLASHVTEG